MDLIKEIYSDLKSGFRWFVKLSPKVKKQKYWMYGFISLVLLVFFLISHSHKENGMTDWISALANVVMAGAAVTGVIFAKNWKSDATVEKLIEVGTEVFLDDFPKLLNFNASPATLNRIVFVLKTIKQNGLINEINAHELYYNSNDFLDECNKYYDVHRSFLARDKKIHHLGWQVNPNYSEVHSSILDSSYYTSEFSYYLCGNLVNFMRSVSIDVNVAVDIFLTQNYTTLKINNEKKIDELLEEIEVVMLYKSTLKSAVELIRNDKVEILSYFIPKK